MDIKGGLDQGMTETTPEEGAQAIDSAVAGTDPGVVEGPANYDATPNIGSAPTSGSADFDTVVINANPLVAASVDPLAVSIIGIGLMAGVIIQAIAIPLDQFGLYGQTPQSFALNVGKALTYGSTLAGAIQIALEQAREASSAGSGAGSTPERER